jgi:hypothetical protein
MAIVLTVILIVCQIICMITSIGRDRPSSCFGNGNPDPGPGPYPTPSFPTPPVNPQAPTERNGRYSPISDWMNRTPSTHVELLVSEDVKRVVGSASRLMTLVTLKVSSGLIPDDEVSTWQARIDKHLSACGCKESTLGMVAFALLYVTFYFPGAGDLSELGAVELLSCAAFAVVGAAIGKAGGVVYGRMRMKRTLEALLKVSQNRGIDRWDGARVPDAQSRLS